MALAGASAVSIGGLAVVTLLWTSTEPAADTNVAADVPAVVTDSPAASRVATAAEPSPAAPAAQTASAPAETADGTAALAPPLDLTPPAETQAYERMRGFDRAFAEISRAKHPPGHANAKKKGPVQAAAEISAKLAPPRRTAAAYDASHQQ